jgi:hypothetical protein
MSAGLVVCHAASFSAARRWRKARLATARPGLKLASSCRKGPNL